MFLHRKIDLNHFAEMTGTIEFPCNLFSFKSNQTKLMFARKNSVIGEFLIQMKATTTTKRYIKPTKKTFSVKMSLVDVKAEKV